MSDVEARSLVAIARKDFDDARRSKLLWILGALFVVFLGGIAILPVAMASIFNIDLGLLKDLSTEFYLRTLQGPVSWFFPVIGLLLGYKSIAGEIDSGTGRILHTLPHSRLDVVLGKFLGRTLILWLTLAVGLVVALVVSLAFYDSADPVLFLRFSALSMIFGAAWVSVGVGISGVTRSSSIATALAVGAFLFFYFVYGALRRAVLVISQGQLFVRGEPPTWYTVSGIVTPGGSYGLTLPSGVGGGAATSDALPTVLASPRAGVVLLAVWIVLPLVVGYLRFRQLDL